MGEAPKASSTARWSVYAVQKPQRRAIKGQAGGAVDTASALARPFPDVLQRFLTVHPLRCLPLCTPGSG